MADRTDHDALYHRLFADPRIVAQLLHEFGDGLWLGDLDLDGMERLNAKFHADSGERRAGDMIWRILRRDGGNAYLALLLEFQSKSDPFMALRILTYASLLWQQLVNERRLPSHGKLPPLLPVVLYNGESRWRAPVAFRHLIGLPEESPWWPWQPDLRYHLIDPGALSQAELERRKGLPALWFRLEAASDPAEVVAVADAVLAWLTEHPGFAAARAAFTELMGTMMAPMGPDLRVPTDLLEVCNMLATRAEQWKQAWRLEGLQEGRLEGEAALLLRQMAHRFGPSASLG